MYSVQEKVHGSKAVAKILRVALRANRLLAEAINIAAKPKNEKEKTKMTKQPIARIIAKPKNNKDADPVRLFAVWEGPYSPNLSFEAKYEDRITIAKIVLSDGSEITRDSHWISYREAQNDRRNENRIQDDDMPF